MMGAGLSSRPAHQRRRIKSFGEEQEFRKYILSVSHDVHKNGEAEPTFQSDFNLPCSSDRHCRVPWLREIRSKVVEDVRNPTYRKDVNKINEYFLFPKYDYRIFS